MRRIALAILCACAAFAGPAEVKRAEELYRQTKYREALKILGPVLGSDAAAHRVAGQAAYGAGDFKKAVEYFEKAAAIEPASMNFLWLGRAYGRRAETSLPFTAPHYASKARTHFEKAVQLDPKNGEALNDLFDYYVQAPGFLGGGLDKAEALLPKIRAVDPVEEMYALARLSESRKDFHSAEQHLKRAADMAPRSVGRVIDVARFLARRRRFSESFSWLSRAEKIAPEDPKVLFNRALTHIEAKKDLHTARTLLQQYLQAPLTPDLPPRDEAEKLLKQTTGGA